MAYNIQPKISGLMDYIKVGDELVGFTLERFHGDPLGDKPPSGGS